MPSTRFADDGDDSLISASKMAEQLHMQVEEFAQTLGIDLDGARGDLRSAHAQEVLRNAICVFTTATAVFMDELEASKWMTEPAREFRGKTALMLVAEGRTENVVGFLHSIESGFVG